METCLPKILEKSGWSQAEFAKLLGVHATQISRWISAEKPLPRATEAGFLVMLRCIEEGRIDIVISELLADNTSTQKERFVINELRILADLIIAAVKVTEKIDPDAQISPELFREAMEHLDRTKVILNLYGFAPPRPTRAEPTLEST